MTTTDAITLCRLQKKHNPLLRRTSLLLITAIFLQYTPLAMAAPIANETDSVSEQISRSKRGFGRTAQKGAFTVKAVKESGEYGGALTPVTENTAAFSAAGNEAFGACMQLWNQHRWEAAVISMREFLNEHPNDPWTGEAELHIACYHKYRHEYRQAEEILVRLYEQNTSNPVGRKALVRLGHLFFQTFRYQKADEVFRTLLEMNPIEEEKSYAVNWLFHIQRAWAAAAHNRECGPKSFGYAAWLTEHSAEVASHREGEIKRRSLYRRDKSFPAYMPSIRFSAVAEQYPWAAVTMPEDGLEYNVPRRSERWSAGMLAPLESFVGASASIVSAPACIAQAVRIRIVSFFMAFLLNKQESICNMHRSCAG